MRNSEKEEREPSVFGLNLSVPERFQSQTRVAALRPSIEGDFGTLDHSLSGEGHSHFVLDSSTSPHTVRVKVAADNLGYEENPVCELGLHVTDSLDHENSPDPSIDHTLAVQVNLENMSSSVVSAVAIPNFVMEQEVTFTALVTDFGGEHSERVVYRLTDSFGTHKGVKSGTITCAVSGTETVSISFTYLPSGGDRQTDTQRMVAEPVSVTWRGRYMSGE